jgi:uncharacterized membrane protein
LNAKPQSQRTTVALCLILFLYAVARILEITPNRLPQTAIVALDVLSALAFALVHGARQYSLRAILTFTAICIVVSNVIENVGVLTGFPFGRYYFAGLMGPKIFNVPILLGLAYIGMAYVSFVLASLIAGNPKSHLTGARLVTVPLIASFIMVAWDLAQDPIWATVLRGWVWLDGGPWFGVPITNYQGWFLTVFIICLLFAFCLSKRTHAPTAATNAGLRAAILFYALCAAGNILQRIPKPNPAVVADPTGKLWRVADITAASALVSIFLMGSFAVFAWIRLVKTSKPATD